MNHVVGVEVHQALQSTVNDRCDLEFLQRLLVHCERKRKDRQKSSSWFYLGTGKNVRRRDILCESLPSKQESNLQNAKIKSEKVRITRMKCFTPVMEKYWH